jgi:hypothetical protein
MKPATMHSSTGSAQSRQHGSLQAGHVLLAMCWVLGAPGHASLDDQSACWEGPRPGMRGAAKCPGTSEPVSTISDCVVVQPLRRSIEPNGNDLPQSQAHARVSTVNNSSKPPPKRIDSWLSPFSSSPLWGDGTFGFSGDSHAWQPQRKQCASACWCAPRRCAGRNR